MTASFDILNLAFGVRPVPICLWFLAKNKNADAKRGFGQAMAKEAMRLGVVTQFSSTEVADAMEFMARKGFDTEIGRAHV